MRVEQSRYKSDMTWSQYMPTISLNANYYNTNSNRVLYGMNRDYSNYGFTISMPLNVNAPLDIEARELDYMKNAVSLQDKKREAVAQYTLALDTLKIIDKKIALARSDERLYKNLLKRTKDELSAGNKTPYDVETMRNSMNASYLDAKIYEIEKQIELLALYAKIEK